MPPFHGPSLRHEDTYGRTVVPRKSLGMSAAAKVRKKLPWLSLLIPTVGLVRI